MNIQLLLLFPFFQRFYYLTDAMTGRVRAFAGERTCIWAWACVRLRMHARGFARVRAFARGGLRLCRGACICTRVRAFVRKCGRLRLVAYCCVGMLPFANVRACMLACVVGVHACSPLCVCGRMCIFSWGLNNARV